MMTLYMLSGLVVLIKRHHVGGYSAASQVSQTTSDTAFIPTCELDWDCPVPLKCCDGIFFHYCCDAGMTPYPTPVP